MKFYLTTPDPTATTIVTETGKMAYAVTTTMHRGKPLTVVRRAIDGAELASLQWHSFNSSFDRVTIGGRQFNMLDFKKGKLLLTESAVFCDANQVAYEWKLNKKKNVLELTAKDTRQKIVTVDLIEGSFVGTAPPAMLSLNDRAMQLQDMCIISWLFLEKQRRHRHNAAGINQEFNPELQFNSETASQYPSERSNSPRPSSFVSYESSKPFAPPEPEN
ncbi:hypothetical protein SISNIDRAFT_452952 [Sistotremastrum niveocremeum HHB9708]|nr:hypothetical protein SISNIDRAFT_452952 [Sistotremastrum niveocremeum HHB9708]